jgi:hypothetical protein
MRKLQVGDKVRFLNTVGGGQVKSFLNKQLVIVEEENGFDIPVLISECVVVETAGNEKLGQPAPEPSSKEPEPVARIEAAEPVTETIEGEKITTCLLFLPVDARNMTQTSFECYFVNDSNYFLFLNYMSRENNSWKSRYNGIVEPNTQIFIEEFDKSQLNDLTVLTDTDDLYGSGICDKVLTIQTFYEQQWRARGLTIKYLRFLSQKKENWKEPDIKIEKDEYRSFGRDARL